VCVLRIPRIYIRIRIRIRFYWPSEFAQTRNLTWQSDSQCAYTEYKSQHKTIQYKQCNGLRSLKKYIQGGMPTGALNFITTIVQRSGESKKCRDKYLTV